MYALDAGSELRESGIEALGALPWGAEPCQLYREPSELAEVLIPFLEAGLAGNERCLCITGDALTAGELRALLLAGIADFELHEREGRLEVRDAPEGEHAPPEAGWDELHEQWLELESLALSQGYSGLRVASDASWLGQRARASSTRTPASPASGLEGRHIVALCAYRLDALSATDLLTVLRRHGSCLLREEQGWHVLGSAGALLAEVMPERSHHSPSAVRLKRTAEVNDTEEAAPLQLQTLQVVTSALCEALTSADVRRVVTSEMTSALGARSAAVALASEGSALSLIPDTVAALGSEPPVANVQHSGWRVSAQALVVLQVAYDDGAASWPSLESASVGLPLLCGSRRVGAVVFELERPRELGAAERVLFENMAHQLALALDRARMYELAKLECARAEEASRAKDEFLALLGHELRNPLSPMLTAVELMRIRAGDVALKERAIIERQTRHMLRLVDDLLDVSRITRGALPLSRARVPLSEVIERAIELAEPMIEERTHRFNVSLPSDERWLDVDPHRITQALANVLLNAAKYTPSGGAIELTGAVVDGRVYITVHDNGVGMDRPLLLRVFEPFVQRQQPPDRRGGGLGLGLTIARRLVELHGGTLSADSPGVGLGSTFVLELPLATNDRAESAPPTLAPPRPRSEPSTEAVSVLVVDDNVDAADMLAEALRARGAEVRVAHDGPRALEQIDTFRPDIALLDIGLPGMDGCDLARHLQARLSDAPPMLVAVTGYGQPSDRARTRHAGFHEHLVKPVDMARLSALIKSAARRV